MNGWVFNKPNGGWEFTACLAAVSLTLFLAADDGALALARVVRRRSR